QLISTLFALSTPRPQRSTLFPYTTLFRSHRWRRIDDGRRGPERGVPAPRGEGGHAGGIRGPLRREPRGVRPIRVRGRAAQGRDRDRKSTRLNSSHVKISYAVFCLKKKIKR